ncbi:transglutaminase domain-containing protein [Coprobacillaceae bacterium CR2/5/TPMF4]|nr:transglutaminase domain-containing protein [Coprobacillaceae bacterium CR2/5/TPMF4]
MWGTDRDEYHAWVEVYLEGQGWVNPDIFIDKNVDDHGSYFC